MAPTTALANMRGAVLTSACQQRRGLESSRETSGDEASSDGDTDHPDKSDDDLACKFSYNEMKRTSMNEHNESSNHMCILVFV